MINPKERLDKSNVDVLILCGGRGTRFEEVSENKPKALATINGVPLIDLVIERLEKQGFKSFILAVGFRKDKIVDHFNGSQKNISFSEETSPLGTGGAIKNAKSYLKSGYFIVMNGDLLCEMNYEDLIESHLNKDALLTLTVSKADKTEDYGNIVLDNEHYVSSFSEKKSTTKSDYVSAGTYIMDKNIFKFFPSEKAFSLEIDFFEKNTVMINTHIIDKSFLDIGTPERFKIANLINKNRE